MDADRQALAATLRSPGFSDWLKSQFSLETPEQDLLSPQTAGDVALGLIPGVGQLTAARDVARGIKAGDPTQTALAAASFLPFGKLAGALKSKIIAGKEARHAPVEDMLEGAKELARGESPNTVWSKRGVFRGGEEYSRPMKWEIPDQAARLGEFDVTIANKPNVITHGEFQGKLGDFLKHPELFKNYPEIADWFLAAEMSPKATGAGSFMRAEGDLGTHALRATGRDPDELMKTLLHEVQHGVQSIEDFASGTNPEYIKNKLVNELKKERPHIGPLEEARLAQKAKDMYERTAGEVEARNVEARLKNSAAFNRSISPIETQEFPFEQQIY